MMDSHAESTALSALRRHAIVAAGASVAPFSRAPAGAAILLADGQWVSGSRFESATYPLTVPPLQAAYVAACAAGRRDIVAAAFSEPPVPGTWEWLGAAIEQAPLATTPDTAVFARPLPEVGPRLATVLDASLPSDDTEGVSLAREVASGAFAPFSSFPVGCVLLYETADGRALLVPGVNVEHPDWTRGLCAERSAVAAAISLGPGTIRRAYLSCLQDAAGTPCGACRQILAEAMPDVPLVIDRGSAEPERVTPRDLLPGFFSGARLHR